MATDQPAGPTNRGGAGAGPAWLGNPWASARPDEPAARPASASICSIFGSEETALGDGVALGFGGSRPKSRYRYTPDPVQPDEMLGLAKDFSIEQYPINGLRHPRIHYHSGWYIWSQERFPSDDNAFPSTHTKHLLDVCSDIEEYLALPPGWRFLVAPNYEDVWYDASLFNV